MSGANRKILVVDDDLDIRETLESLLQDEGYVTVSAGNGRQALDQLDGGFAPDVVLLDLMMPVMDGATFLAELRRRPSPQCDLPVIVLSAAHNPRAPLAQLVLAKPARLEVLLEAVDRLAPSAA